MICLSLLDTASTNQAFDSQGSVKNRSFFLTCASKSEKTPALQSLSYSRQRNSRNPPKIASCPAFVLCDGYLFPFSSVLSLTTVPKCYLSISLLSSEDRASAESGCGSDIYGFIVVAGIPDCSFPETMLYQVHLDFCLYNSDVKDKNSQPDEVEIAKIHKTRKFNKIECTSYVQFGNDQNQF